MSDFEEQEYWVYQRQRFDAALAFATKKTWHQSEFTVLPIHKAVKRADELIAELDETRTKTDDNTRF